MLGGKVMKKVLIIGDVMVDEYLEGRVDRISPEAPVPVFLEMHRDLGPGGAANVARNLRAMAVDVRLIGCVGNDYTGEALLGLLNAYDVPCTLVEAADRPTTRKTRYVSQGQQILRVDNETTVPISKGTEDRLIETVYRAIYGASFLVISDYAKGVMTERLLREIIACARSRDIPVVVDPKARNFSVYSRATVLKPNAHELGAATGMPTETDEEVVEASWRVMDDIDIRNVLTTRAEKGMTLVGRDIPPIHIPTAAREIYDVVGAGDTALAAFVAAAAAGMTFEESASVANTAAGIAVGKRGTSAVTLDEIRERAST